VKTDWDEFRLVAVFNLDDAACRTTLPAATLGLKKGVACRLYEFWSEEYMGSFKDQFVAEVPPSSCRLYRIAKARPYPWLLSSTLHVQQGAVEVCALQWNPRRLTLSGTVRRPKGDRGSLYFLMPDQYRLINHEGHGLMKNGRDFSVIIRRDFVFTKSEMDFTLRFAPLKYTPMY
jgi:hypothetical protein